MKAAANTSCHPSYHTVLLFTDRCLVYTTTIMSQGAHDRRLGPKVHIGGSFSNILNYFLSAVINRAMGRSRQYDSAVVVVVGDYIVIDEAPDNCASLRLEKCYEVVSALTGNSFLDFVIV